MSIETEKSQLTGWTSPPFHVVEWGFRRAKVSASRFRAGRCGREARRHRLSAELARVFHLARGCALSDTARYRPHSGLRRDFTPGEEISEDVTAAFYEALAKLPTGRQVVVLENNDPPATLHSQINYTHFSRSAIGRYGFYPVT